MITQERAAPCADRATIERVREVHIAALNAGDVPRWAATFTQDAVRMPPHMPAIIGRERIRKWSGGFMARFAVCFSLTVEEVEIAGDWAFERGTYRLVLYPRGGGKASEENGKYILIYERQAEGGWGIARDIWNSDKPTR